MHKFTFSFILIIFVGCIGQRYVSTYRGNFEEKHYAFQNAIWHNEEKYEYIDAIWKIKFGGINYGEEIGFEWARDTANMKVLFQTLQSIGLSRFISKEDFLYKKGTWCCGKDWEGQSLNEVVETLISTYGSEETEEVYFSSFWKRRKGEGNHKVLFDILKAIDRHYDQSETSVDPPGEINDTIQQLLEFDLRLMESKDSIERKAVTLSYFQYLNELGMAHSAHDLLMVEQRKGMNMAPIDSLIQVLKPDTISEERYYETRYNQDGWIIYGYGK